MANYEPSLVLKDHTGNVKCTAFSDDGQLVASAGFGDFAIRVHNTTTGLPLLTIKAHTQYVWTLLMTPDGQHIISASSDKTVRMFEMPGGKEVLCLKHASEVGGQALSPDGTLIVSSTKDGSLHVWQIGDGDAGNVITACINAP